MNEKLNIPPFVKGDKVVYITGYHMKKNSIHIVRGIYKLPCGCYEIYIDTPSPNSINGVTVSYCRFCDEDFNITNTAGWQSRSFRKVQESKFRAVSFEKVMEETEIICEN